LTVAAAARNGAPCLGQTRGWDTAPEKRGVAPGCGGRTTTPLCREPELDAQ